MDRKEIGRKIRKAREQKNLTEKELGKLIDKNDITICNWENGNVKPRLDDLIKIAKALDINVKRLTVPNSSIFEVLSDLEKQLKESDKFRAVLNSIDVMIGLTEDEISQVDEDGNSLPYLKGVLHGLRSSREFVEGVI